MRHDKCHTSLATHRTRMGQNTGMSKASNRVMQKAMATPLTREYLQCSSVKRPTRQAKTKQQPHQNFSSGRRRIKGRNSPLSLVGSTPTGHVRGGGKGGAGADGTTVGFCLDGQVLQERHAPLCAMQALIDREAMNEGKA